MWERVRHRLGDEAGTKGFWAWTGLRILLGWSFLWAFLDKMFGLGFATCRVADTGAIDYLCDAAMINGGSPTYGFLTFATQNSHTGFLVDWMAPTARDAINYADVLFVTALLLGGLSLMLGIGVRLGAFGGALLMAFMFIAADVWPPNNPVNSSHVIEMVAFLGIASVGPGKFALQGWFSRKFPRLSWVR